MIVAKIRNGVWCALVALAAALPMGSCIPVEPKPGLLDAARDLTAALPVFPGAEGYGTDTPAGRGGAVIRVTTLAAEGPGSLREAAATPGARTIVFEVGGAIDLTDDIVVGEPFVTIAGETAPSPGITLAGAGLRIVTHDVLVRHLRVRVGDRPEGPPGDARDGIGVAAGAPGTVWGVVVDRCSAAWAVDENGSTAGPVEDVTFSHGIWSEGLSHSIHPEGEHSKGLLVGDHARRVAVIGNLFAHNLRRSPFVKGDVSALVANNWIYDPGEAAIHLDDPEGSGMSLVGVLANGLGPGPDTWSGLALVDTILFTKSTTEIYGLGNDAAGHLLLRSLFVPQTWRPITDVGTSPVRVAPLTLEPVAALRDRVLARAGARSADRDATDARIVAEVEARTGSIIDSPDEVEGLPTPAPTFRALALPEDPNGDADADGYTNLEEWLHGFAAAVENP